MPDQGGPKGEREYHDYERGEYSDAMHTDPLCRICGHGNEYYLHQEEDKQTVDRS